MWDYIASLPPAWQGALFVLLHPYFVGFYVPIAVAVFAGRWEAQAHCRPGEAVRYHREFFALGSELCLGAITIVIAALVLFFWWPISRTANTQFPFDANWLFPMLAFNGFVWRLAWDSRLLAIRNAPFSSDHDLLPHAATRRRIPRSEVMAALAMSGLLIALNSAIFQDQEPQKRSKQGAKEKAHASRTSDIQ